jgi:NAD(P)-dependent dehydrogenase (short-subunit alcohol dehydrogenase family)
MTVSLVTGANKGIGYATAQLLVDAGHTVYVAARDVDRGQKAALALGARFVQLDVTDDASVETALESVITAEGRLDVLVNNAGLSALRTDGPGALNAFDVNVVGVIRVTQASLNALQKSANPVVVNVTSDLGSFAAVTDPARRQFAVHAPVYSASKAAVNMLTLQYAKAYPGIKFNAVAPGFTATDLTGGRGRPVDQSAKAVLRMAVIGADGPTGTLQDDDGEMAW